MYKLRKAGYDLSHIELASIPVMCEMHDLSDANGWYQEQYLDWFTQEFPPRPPTVVEGVPISSAALLSPQGTPEAFSVVDGQLIPYHAPTAAATGLLPGLKRTHTM